MSNNSKPGPTGLLCLDLLSQYPGISSKKAGILLYAQNPHVFTSAEHARTVVRYYRGSNGEKNREKLSEETYKPRFSAPESEEKEFEPYIIPDSVGSIMAFGDVHIPYHSQDALEIAMEYAMEKNPDMLILMGDFMDCYQVSRWERDPRLRDMQGEITMTKEILASMKAALPNTKLVYKFGNHELRWDKYLMSKAPELYGIPEIRLQALLDLEGLGIDFVDQVRVIRYKHLNLIHGHEYVSSMFNPVNPARGLYLRAKKNAACFHHHQTSEHTETDISGGVTTCWSVGCLCHLKPAYMPYNKWNHGFLEIRGEGEMFHVSNKKIIAGRVV